MANVEATVKVVKRGIKNGKSRLRGLVRNRFYLILTSISVNLTRIHKYEVNKVLFDYFCHIMKGLLQKTEPILKAYDAFLVKEISKPICFA